MSKKIFSPQEWENVPSKQESSYSTALALNEPSSDLHAEVESIIAEIEARGIDMEPGLIADLH